MDKKKLIGFYDYTVILTYLGFICAVFGIMQVLSGHFRMAMFAQLAAGVCDMFDGAVASTKKNRSVHEKSFGIQIDSLSDLVSFGLLPALFVFQLSGQSLVSGIVAGAFILCGLIRLAFYNVQEAERQKTTTASRSCFLGVPITTSALLLPALYLIYSQVTGMPVWIFTLVLGLVGCGYIVGIKIPKPKKVGIAVILVLGLAEFAGLLFLTGV